MQLKYLVAESFAEFAIHDNHHLAAYMSHYYTGTMHRITLCLVKTPTHTIIIETNRIAKAKSGSAE